MLPLKRNFLLVVLSSTPTVEILNKFIVHSQHFFTDLVSSIFSDRYGPMFGAGADLCISDDCHERPESYSNLPHSYDGPQASCSLLMGDYNFIVKDYEVFGLKTEPFYERV